MDYKVCMQMGSGTSRMMKFSMIITCLMVQLRVVFGIRFVIDKDECFSHNILYEGDIIHVSFVVIKADASWQHMDDGIDLLIKGPGGETIREFHDKISDKYEFMAQRKGIYHFCFSNKSPFHETVDFDVLVGHYRNSDQHATTEHFNPIVDHISKLEEALHNIQFEQHWLEAQTDRQALVNESMSHRAVYKAIFESLALIGVSTLQVFLLQRLFERKLGTSRV